ncbi:MAG: tRNA pseudouridine(55) synthase TruB [Saprospiraceae bacterium]
MDDPLPGQKFIDGAFLLVNKPKSWTSFDVVNKIRSSLKQSLGIKKIKVGHAGTLDPMATGLLIICTGKMTKKLSNYQGLDKTYTGVITLGATTASYDAECEPENVLPLDELTEEAIEEARKSFIGDLMQLPPIYSAIKVDGQPLYKQARAGKKVTVEPRPVTIHEFEITQINLPEIHFKVRCSKGTYIRSLAHDFGQKLGVGGYLTELTRTAIGKFKLEDAWELEALIDHIESISPTVNS